MGAGNNHIYGDAGDNYLRGSLGDHVLIGAGGNDTLIGGTGDDTLNGDGDGSLQGDIAGTVQGTILQFDGSGFDATRVQNATVVKVGGVYKMLYAGLPFSNDYQIGLATSSDGPSWAKYSADPVISHAMSPSWASFRVLPVTLIYENGIYKLWFNGDNTNLGSDPGRQNAFGYATSPDGISWTINPNAIRTEVDGPNGNGYDLREVVKLGDQYHAYFVHHLPTGDVLDHAVSIDGVNFSDDATVGVASGYSLLAARVIDIGGTESVFAVWQDSNGVDHYGTSIDGVNFTIGGTITLPLNFRVTDVLFDNGQVKFFGNNGVGNINWSFGNENIVWAIATPPSVVESVGDDTMVGGSGNDTYFVNSLGDVVTENANEGTDEVCTTLATYRLPGNVENLTFTGVGNFSGAGNDLANIITGGAGVDSLVSVAGTGVDTLIGGLGNDLYYVHASGDVVTENPGEGTGDTVFADINFTLPANVEGLYPWATPRKEPATAATIA